MHVVSTFNIGGLEMGIIDVISRLPKEKFSHSFCVFSEDLGAFKRLENQGVALFIIKRFFANDPSTIIRLIFLLRKERPDIVRTYNWGGVEGILAAKLSGINSLIIHSEHGFSISEVKKKKTRRILARRLLLKYCYKVIAVSRVLKEWLVKDVKIPENNIMCIPNGCDTVRFHPGREMLRRTALGIAENDIVIGNVGALKKIKGQDLLLRAFSVLTKKFENLKLLIIGEGPERNYFHCLAVELGVENNVIFLGETVETEVFYRVMDIFILSSLSEAMPHVLLEAMSTSLPIIATDVGDVRSMLGESEAAIMVNPGDVDALTRSVEYFLSNNIVDKKVVSFLRQKVEADFSIDKMVDSYINLYSVG